MAWILDIFNNETGRHSRVTLGDGVSRRDAELVAEMLVVVGGVDAKLDPLEEDVPDEEAR